ncbi:hypothetical protein MVEN_01618600 [Mycena venus]|uniref:Uncharacterized protein n=1 Tax=Mycena venus TaxID=2733690 RepID=A0A8H6XSU8_9AGAR|nr:hypothetical protein MVEN_01618600 [Mycena venus]
MPTGDKKTTQSGGTEGELNVLRGGIRLLQQDIRRVQGERNQAQAGYIQSQVKVTNLEHRVTIQQWEINELKAKVRALQAASTDPSPPRPVAPAAKNVIEILDDEEINSGEQSGGLERDASRTDRLLHPAPSPEQAKRLYMDCVHIECAPSWPSPAKRVRPASPPLGGSSLSSPRPATPTGTPRAKRPRIPEAEDEEQLQDAAGHLENSQNVDTTPTLTPST